MANTLPPSSLTAARAGLDQKKFSCRELTQAYLDRIQKDNGRLHALLAVYGDDALAHADQLDRRKKFAHPLAGIPMVLKDIFLAAGTKTTAGSKILENYTATYDGTVVEKLKQQDSILLGKSNMDEFACGSSTEHSAFGPTKNPWDATRVPGGSSGGSAAAVAAGMSCFAMGSDTGGSIRQPASLCGIVGLKPTYGRVSRYGLMAMASSLDQIGPFTRTVEDTAIVLRAIAGLDPKDSTTSPQPVPDYAAALRKSIKGLRIGVPKEYFSDSTAGLEDGVRKSFSAALKILETLGAKIVTDISLPHTDYALAAYYVIMPAELSANLARYDGIRYGLSRREAPTLIAQYAETRGAGFGAEIRRRIMLGTYALSAGYYDAYYKKALAVRTLVRQDFEQAFKKVDCLVTPTSPTVAFKIGAKADDPLSMYLADVYTVAGNVAGVPGLSLPVGLAEPPEGGVKLPVGLQLIGKPFDEETILRAGHHLEQAVKFSCDPKL
ncbi:MAG: Asp-tRNA(Asn)/Glu-tRNA(Gln) amidotransferase subunit GatA [Patescibacteria group bacterium]|nr:Asp-tRNA(Asn)/Glu-tRNA(Gln) amidotransferase subunit GatA [Patescibacteria group bacterium]